MRLAAAALAAALAACGGPQEKSDWERRNIQHDVSEELLPEPPAFPRADTLLEFPVSAVPGLRFYIDGETLSVEGGVVRYVLVARSGSGPQNVSFEGLRCRTAEHRRYAAGRADGTWTKAAGSAWRPHAPWHTELQRDYFCPQTQPIRDAAEGVRALREGAHSFSRGLGKGAPLGM
ncbi:MAG: CNP1-like family protein [Betaproteobacteria bacterium]